MKRYAIDPAESESNVPAGENRKHCDRHLDHGFAVKLVQHVLAPLNNC